MWVDSNQLYETLLEVFTDNSLDKLVLRLTRFLEIKEHKYFDSLL